MPYLVNVTTRTGAFLQQNTYADRKAAERFIENAQKANPHLRFNLCVVRAPRLKK